ncbi:MAG: ATP-dependent Clp protease adaptor ClpS [Tepidisphaerales bacterium]
MAVWRIDAWAGMGGLAPDNGGEGAGGVEAAGGGEAGGAAAAAGRAAGKTKRRVRTLRKSRLKGKTKALPRYHVVLLNDDEHTYEYVIDMLADLFAHPPTRGYLLARQVDTQGRAIVLTTHKEHAELKRDQIHAYGSDVRVARCRGSMRAVIEPAD